MPLSADSALPARPRRVLVAGSSGAGKSTLARVIATSLGLAYTDLDGLHHGAGWVPRPDFLDDVRRLAAQDAWVTEWQYSAARPVLLERADLLVYLLHPRWVSFSRVVRRTVRRRLWREELWNGNFEPPMRTILTDPDYIIRWHRRSYASNRRRHAELTGSPPDRLTIVELRRPADVGRWARGPLADAAHVG